MRSNTALGASGILARLALWVGLVILSVTATRLLIDQARAEFAFDYSTLSDRLNLAPQLDPTVADYAKTRGDYWFKSVIPPRLDLAAFEYRRALELNPREAFHWSDWGQVCWSLGRIEEARKAFAMAVSLDPSNYVIQGELGSFFLLNGDIDAAVPHHARAIQLNPGLAPGIYTAYWNLGRAPHAVAETLLGENPLLLRRYFLDALTWVDPQQADRLWQWLRQRNGAPDPRCYNAYFEFLIANALYAPAHDLWEEITRQFYETTWDRERDAFWNGRFDHPLAFNGGLEWRIANRLPPGARAVVRSSQGVEQSSCLWIHFSGKENVDFSHVRHFFFVEPGRTYRLHCWARSIAVSTDSGPYVRLTLHTQPPLVRSGKMIKGTGVWELEEAFAVPPACYWGEIAIRRDPIMKLNNKIKGDVYFDDFALDVVTSPTSETLQP